MDADKFREYLDARYKGETDWYDKRSAQNKRWYSILQWGLIIFGAASPVIFAITGPIDNGPRAVAVAVAFLAAVFSGVLKAFQFQEQWISYRTTAETLKKEIHYYDARVGEYSETTDPEAMFVERVESLISRENTLWLTSHEPEKKAK